MTRSIVFGLTESQVAKARPRRHEFISGSTRDQEAGLPEAHWYHGRGFGQAVLAAFGSLLDFRSRPLPPLSHAGIDDALAADWRRIGQDGFVVVRRTQDGDRTDPQS